MREMKQKSKSNISTKKDRDRNGEIFRDRKRERERQRDSCGAVRQRRWEERSGRRQQATVEKQCIFYIYACSIKMLIATIVLSSVHIIYFMCDMTFMNAWWV